MDCLFCTLVKGDIPATVLYQDADVIAFEDSMPQAPTHFLVIPKQHISTLNDLKEDNVPILGKLPIIAAKVAKAKGISESGYRIAMNCNDMGGQTVYHIHMHVLGGRSMTWPPG